MDRLTDQELDVLRNISVHDLFGVPRSSQKLNFKCPFHRERTPSFFIFPDNHTHCFGCGKTTFNAIDFTMALGYTFDEAITELQKYI